MRERDLVVLSHLRWTWVWQRPQHLIARMAGPNRTWFVEEPAIADVARPRLRQELRDGVNRIWLEVPPGQDHHLYFGDPAAAGYARLLCDALPDSAERVAWLYTPLALGLAEALQPALLVYDVMDDLASFAHAPPRLRTAQRELLRVSDVVFTGGRSLDEGVRRVRPHGTWLFPSGVDAQHYAPARVPRPRRERRTAGYIGVLDERLDLALVAGLASALPDWDISMVGPVAKIDPATLPQAPNLRYPGACRYCELPDVLASFDVALMPFALNESTRSISPTKTLEYLAAGLPVVSTAVPDVVRDYGHVVDIAAGVDEFAAACARARPPTAVTAAAVDALLERHSWDRIAQQMGAIVTTALANRRALEEETA